MPYCPTHALSLNRRVLIVDDEPSVLKAYMRGVRKLIDPSLPGGAFEFVCETDLPASIKHVRGAAAAGQPFAMAFVDQRFPGEMQGLEGVAHMLEVDPCLEVVMVTGSSLSDRDAAALLPPERFLVLKKPLDGEELRACVRSLTHKWALRHAAQRRIEELGDDLARRVGELEEANEALRKEQTARAKAQTELLRAQKLESVGRLASGIAHEINTPAQFVADNLGFVTKGVSRLLELIDAQAQALGDDEPRELKRLKRKLKLDYLRRELPPALTQATDGMDRVAALVRAMKDFAHPGQTSKVVTDLNACVSSTSLVARGCYKRVAELELELAPEGATAETVASEINQAILVLVVNAAQAISAVLGPNPAQKGHIVVRTSTRAGVARLEVEDNGPGVDPDIEARIFDPFFTTRAVGDGSGQGLAIAHNIVVERHGGRLFVEPTPHGARFVMELPREAASATAA